MIMTINNAAERDDEVGDEIGDDDDQVSDDGNKSAISNSRQASAQAIA